MLECSLGVCWSSGSADIYLLKVSNKKARAGCAICSKLTIKTRHGVKVGTGTLGPGPGTPLKVQKWDLRAPTNFKSGTPLFSLMNSFFSEYFFAFFYLFIFVSFLNEIQNKYQLCATEINSQH